MRVDKIWFALEISVDSNATEAIEFAFNELDALGTEINNLGKTPTESWTVIGYFNEKPDDETVENQIAEALRIYGISANVVKTFAWREVENKDWLAEWKKHWRPTEVGRFIIAPPWEDVRTTDQIVIRIEPNMAFGTGTHETTQLCLKTIGDIYRPGQTFLDVGTGTGILAIAAAKLATENTEKIEKEIKNLSVNSVAKILACDTDADSVKIAKANAIANGVGDHIEFAYGSLGDETPVFVFVCANLTIDVIVPILPLLIKKTRSVLLLSGILREQRDTIAAELAGNQVSNFKFEYAGEWISATVSLS